MNRQEQEYFRLWVEHLECWIVNSSGMIVKAKDLRSAIMDSHQAYYALHCGGAWFMEHGDVRSLISQALYGRRVQDIDVINALYEEHEYAYMAIFPATKRLYEHHLSKPHEIPPYKIVNDCADIDSASSVADRRSEFINLLRSLGIYDE